MITHLYRCCNFDLVSRTTDERIREVWLRDDGTNRERIQVQIYEISLGRIIVGVMRAHKGRVDELKRVLRRNW